MPEKIIKITDGVNGIFVQNRRFKTTLISFNIYLPLKKETVAEYALLPFILTSCGEKYPDFSRLNYKLNKLYGASLSASTEKLGDTQLLRMGISVINDEYTLSGESIVKQASELMLNLIFSPSVSDNEFKEEDLKREKRKAIEHIKGEMSEKRIYAKNRLIEEMYKDEDYGTKKCGNVEDIEKITGKSLYNAWQTMLRSAFVQVQVIGANIPDGFFEDIKLAFQKYERKNITDVKLCKSTRAVSRIKRVEEKMNVSQGKLVMGFSCDLCGNDDKTLPLMVATDIFGGGPYSKLFTNVREKQSLCYYCVASAIRVKGLLTVESGIEFENAEKAEKEILKQLKALKEGKISDFEYNSSIKSIADSLRSYDDSQNSIDLWYAIKIANDAAYTPNEIADRISTIKKEDIIEASNGIKLNTVYKLVGKELVND